MSIDAMKKARLALDSHYHFDIIAELDKAIEAADKVEPVGTVEIHTVRNAVSSGWSEYDILSIKLNIGHRVKEGDLLYTTPQPAPHVQEKYNELLFAVANKYPNESRHETALRYIKEREARIDSVACQDAPKVPK